MQNKVPKLQNINSFGSVITPLFLSSNGYTHHPLKVKSHCCPLHTEDVMPKPPHTSLFSETVGNLHGTELWGRTRGNRSVWREKGTTHAERVSGGELSVGSLWHESDPCTCYMRPSPLVQSHINTDNPVTLSTPREDRTSSLYP